VGERAVSVELRAKDGDDGVVEFGGMGVLGKLSRF
jgi:hypothetical protein